MSTAVKQSIIEVQPIIKREHVGFSIQNSKELSSEDKTTLGFGVSGYGFLIKMFEAVSIQTWIERIKETYAESEKRSAVINVLMKL